MRCFPGLILISITGLSAAALAVAIPKANRSCKKTQVVILGAGVAGLTAAEALNNASVSDFVIVERNDYIGGRAHHVTFGKQKDGTPYSVEIGANWIQGLSQVDGPANPIWYLAQKHSLRTAESNYSSLLTYDESGYHDYTNLIDEYDHAYELASVYASQLLSDNKPDVSGRTGLASGGWRPQYSDMHRQTAEWWRWDFESAVTPESGSLKFTVASSDVTLEEDNALNQFVIDGEGLSKIFIKQASEFLTINDTRVMLNTIVRKVTYSDDSVKVDMEDGTCIEAEHAICTFSIGVLQNKVVQFFPDLPDWKSDAIEGFQMTTYTKLFMQFNETFWDSDAQFLLYADPVERGWYPLFQSLTTPGFLEDSNIIFATVTGPQSYIVESQSDEETEVQIMDILRAMFPDKNVPKPLDFMYSRWSQEEWVYGSYSNWPIGFTLEKQQDLRANVGRLWFAGEAGSTQYYGYLHGAFFEGREIGIRLAGILKGNCSLIETTSHECGSLPRSEKMHSK